MQITLFASINQSIGNILYSADRLNYLNDINLDIAQMILVSAYFKIYNTSPNLPLTAYPLFKSKGEVIDIFNESSILLREAASNLKEAQTDLSLKTSGLSQASLKKINPENVKLKFLPVAGMPLGYVYTIWQAIMETVISSYTISGMEYDQVDEDINPTVYFVCKNSLNGILMNLDKSTNAILDETSSMRDANVYIFLILLCVASASLTISTAILIPVIRNVKTNKQDVLELFMHVTKSIIDEELQKVKKFLSTFHINLETDMNAEREKTEEKQVEEEGKTAGPETHFKKGWERGHQSRKKQERFKRLALGIGMLSFKFLFIILLMESFFILTYFLSTTFLYRVSSLTKEMSQLISRLPQHGLFLLIVKYNIIINNIECQYIKIMI